MTDETIEDQEMTSSQRRFGVRIDPGISIGHIIGAIPSLVLVIWFLSGKMSSVDNTQDQMKTFKIDLSSDWAAFKKDVGQRLDGIQALQNDQFKILRSDIANIPEFQATLKLVNQRLDRDEVRADVMSAHLDDVAGKGVQNSADIVGILRTVGAAQKIQR